MTRWTVSLILITVLASTVALGQRVKTEGSFLKQHQ